MPRPPYRTGGLPLLGVPLAVVGGSRRRGRSVRLRWIDALSAHRGALRLTSPEGYPPEQGAIGCGRVPATTFQLRSLVESDRIVELSLDTVEVPEPGPDEVIVGIEASPINPSDLGLLLAGADVTAAVAGGSADRPVVTAPLPDAAMRAVQDGWACRCRWATRAPERSWPPARLPPPRPCSARRSPWLGAGMYAQYRCVDASLCLELPDGTQAADGASSFVNPMTVLGMVETMRLENHAALVHTAAASNLGQMLNRLCLEEQIPLVNIVRKQEQEELLRSAGATTCATRLPDFLDDLTAALTETAATLAFDATGGGKLASQI